MHTRIPQPPPWAIGRRLPRGVAKRRAASVGGIRVAGSGALDYFDGHNKSSRGCPDHRVQIWDGRYMIAQSSAPKSWSDHAINAFSLAE